MSSQVDDEVEGKISVRQLTQMMLSGENDQVLNYLRTLPKDECEKTRARLIKNLEEIQNKRKTNTVSRRKPREKENEKGTESMIKRKKQRKRLPDSEIGNSGGGEDKEMVGDYIVEEVLGKGQFGIVYRAVHSETNAVVAIKQVDVSTIERAKIPAVKREAEVMGSLSHKNIVRLFETLQSEEKKCIQFVMEFIDAGSLYKMLKTCGVFPSHIASVCIRQCLDGLAYLHSLNIIHRDIKCDNLLITSEGIIKLADFGNAKAEDHNKNFTVVGTPFWMAPEVIDLSGGGIVSDIWSMGSTALELLTGEPPYFKLGSMQALFHIVEEEHPPIPESVLADPDISHFLLKCCFQKKPALRATVQQLQATEWITKHKQFPILPYNELCIEVRKNNKLSPSSDTRKTSGGSLSKNHHGSGSNHVRVPAPFLIPPGASLEELEGILEEVTQSRDALKQENVELRRLLEQLSQ